MEDHIILIVDDNPDDRELIRRTFRANGIWNRLEMAADGQQALNFLFGEPDSGQPERLPQTQLVILDINMPVLNGLETLRKIRAEKRGKDIPVVILTGTARDVERAELEKLGIADFIQKSAKIDEFIRVTAHLGMKWILHRT